MAERPDPRMLVVLAHPALERSRANRALMVAVEFTPEARLHDLYETYPDFLFDVPAEQERLRAHDVIVLQFPLYWYSGPALLKEWQDLVWLHGFAYGEGSRSLAGKTLACAISTGGRQSAYEAGCKRRFSLAEILRPFEQAAYLCGMTWAEPFASHASNLHGPGDLGAEAARYRDYLLGLNRLQEPGRRAN